eukprot:scaffold71585_cov49-Attheya_sp.AAC.3
MHKYVNATDNLFSCWRLPPAWIVLVCPSLPESSLTHPSRRLAKLKMLNVGMLEVSKTLQLMAYRSLHRMITQRQANTV